MERNNRIMEQYIKTGIDVFISEIDNLRNLVRYQNAPRVSSETVAEHSFFVAAYTLKLYDIMLFDLEKALRIAILHDFSECYISDVPHPIKARYPEIDKALEIAEEGVNLEHVGEQFSKELQEFNEVSTPEGIAVGLADILSVISYSKYEINLGNSKYMKQVHDGAFNRLIKLAQSATTYLKPGVTQEQFFSRLLNYYQS